MHSTVQIGPLIAEINGLNVCSTMRTARQPVMQPRIQTFLLSSYVSCQLRMDKSQKWKIFQLIYMDEFGRTERERERNAHRDNRKWRPLPSLAFKTFYLSDNLHTTTQVLCRLIRRSESVAPVIMPLPLTKFHTTIYICYELQCLCFFIAQCPG